MLQVIYRLEDANGIGPYAIPADKEVDKTYMELANPAVAYASYEEYKEFAPAPWDDGLEYTMDFHSFGFASLEQYLAWFREPVWRENLARLGVKLNKYLADVDVACVVVSPHQAIFHKPAAKLVASYSPTIETEGN